MAQPVLPTCSYQEYLERLEASEIRLEFVDGIVYAMAGGTPAHNRVVMRLTLHVGGQLPKRCEAYGSDQKIRAHNAGYFPDLSIVCGAPSTAPDDPNAFTNPSTLFEVLSPSTAGTDQTTKAERYKALASLQEYVIVAQPERRVVVHRRTPDGFQLEEYGPTDVIALSCGVKLQASELYA